MEMAILSQRASSGGPAGSELAVLIPDEAFEGVQEGYLGSKIPILIPGGHREGLRGSKMPILSPGRPRNGLREGPTGSKSALLIPRRPPAGLPGSETRDLLPRPNLWRSEPLPQGQKSAAPLHNTDFVPNLRCIIDVRQCARQAKATHPTGRSINQAQQAGPSITPNLQTL